MPYLKDIRYSRDECVVAVRGFYQFLVKNFLHEEDILEPPGGIWPHVNPVSFRDLHKSDLVIDLLRHLPYIRDLHHCGTPQPLPHTWFAEWQDHEIGDYHPIYETGDEDFFLPSSVIALTSGREDGWHILLDTEQGVVYWYDCLDEIRDEPTREPVLDNPWEYATDEEATWREQGCAWAITDFFEVLKDQYRLLNFIPLPDQEMIHIIDFSLDFNNDAIRELQNAYRAHGWPDVDAFRRDECMEALRKIVKDRCG